MAQPPLGRTISGTQWAKGAALLAAAAAISKLIGTLQKIPLQNIAGDGVYGIYSVVYPFYILILFVATAGFPVAVSTFVASRLAAGDQTNALRVLRAAAAILIISGCIAFLLLMLGADVIAEWIGNGQTAPAIRSVSVALLFVPVMSALRGYYQGLGNMMPTAVSQVVEQCIRVGTMVFLLLWMTANQIEDRFIAAGATFGAATGAAAGLLVMLLYWMRDRSSRAVSTYDRVPTAHQEPYWRLSGSLMRYAIPVCLGAIAVPVMGIVDSFTLPRLLLEPGMSDGEAMELYGIYSRGQPLVQLAALLVSSMAAAIVPAIAEARAQGNRQALCTRAELSLRMSWLVGSAASIGLALTALPVNRMLYTDEQGTTVIVILAFSAVFNVVNITTAAILQGLGAPMRPALHMLAAAIAKIALNFALVPSYGIEGAAASAVAASALAAGLNVISTVKRTEVHLTMTNYLLKTGAALAVMTAAVYFWIQGLTRLLGEWLPDNRAMDTVVALTAISIGAAAFIAVLIKIKAIDLSIRQFMPGWKRSE